jgi:hypothetical protein
MVQVNIWASSASLGDGHSVFNGTVAQGELASGQLDLTGLVEGETISFMISINAEDAMVGTGIDVGITYGGPKNPVEITDCLVESSHIGGELSITCNGLAPGGMDSLLGGWELTGAPVGATIIDGKISRVGQILEAQDLGTYNYCNCLADSA